MLHNKKIALCCEKLINYGLDRKLFGEYDTVYVRNSLLSTLLLDKPYDEVVSEIPQAIHTVLDEIMDEIANDEERSPLLLPNNTLTERDLLDTAIMGCMTEWPSQVIGKFNAFKNSNGIKAATDYFYALALDSNYIRTDRIARNKLWQAPSPYSDLTITINLTKPEKDPKEIAMLKLLPPNEYPKCALCMQNEGYKGTLSSAARQNHRMIPLCLNDEKWFMQYSPYVYYNEHCIVLRGEHVPMKIEHDTFARLLDFVSQFPHYFAGSNADLPIVGGSILTHDHFQGGNAHMPMFACKQLEEFTSDKFKGIKIFRMHWPLSTVKLVGNDPKELTEAAYALHMAWMDYSDEDNDIIAYTDGTRHNTITPIVRKEGDNFAVYCVLRNNRTNEQYPDGIFHPHAQWHHIKRENIGLIEVMGYFILPGRLDNELKVLADAMVNNSLDTLDESSPAYKHLDWAKEIMEQNVITSENVMDVIRREVGVVCTHVLEDAGVYKMDEHGRNGFIKFLTTSAGYSLVD